MSRVFQTFKNNQKHTMRDGVCVFLFLRQSLFFFLFFAMELNIPDFTGPGSLSEKVNDNNKIINRAFDKQSCACK